MAAGTAGKRCKLDKKMQMMDRSKVLPYHMLASLMLRCSARGPVLGQALEQASLHTASWFLVVPLRASVRLVECNVVRAILVVS